MDLNQEHPSAPEQTGAQKSSAHSNREGQLLGAALGGAVGIVASRLLGLSPRVGATIGSLVGANAERIGPCVFRGKSADFQTSADDGESRQPTPLPDPDGGDPATTSTTATTGSLLDELALDRESESVPRSLQDVLDEYQSLDEGPLRPHRGASEAAPIPASVEDLPIAPPLDLQKSAPQEKKSTTPMPSDGDVQASAVQPPNNGASKSKASGVEASDPPARKSQIEKKDGAVGVMSIWSRPPSTDLDDTQDSEQESGAILNAPGVPEREGTRAAPPAPRASGGGRGWGNNVRLSTRGAATSGPAVAEQFPTALPERPVAIPAPEVSTPKPAKSSAVVVEASPAESEKKKTAAEPSRKKRGAPRADKKKSPRRRARLLWFLIVAGGLAFAAYKLEQPIKSFVDLMTGGTGGMGSMAAPVRRAPAPLAPGQDHNIQGGASGTRTGVAPIERQPAAVPDENVILEEQVEATLPGDHDAGGAETVAIPEDAGVEILPAVDLSVDALSTLAIDESATDYDIVDPIVQEFEEARTVVRSLLVSSSITEAAQWVHDPQRTMKLMKLYYGSEGITPIEGLKIDLVNAGTVPGTTNNAYLMKVVTADHPEGFPVLIEDTHRGYKVDWDAFIQCKDRLMEKFFASKSEVKKSFYLTLKRSHHFASEGDAVAPGDKLCFKVSSPLQTDSSRYAYADMNSAVARELEARVQWNNVYLLVLELEWVPADGEHGGYMRISDFVRDTWRKKR